MGPHAPGEILSSQYQRDRRDWNEWKREIKAEGVGWSDLDDTQREIVRRLIDEVVTNYRPEISASYLKLIDPKSAHFLWLGAVELAKPHYFRLTAGDFVYEFDNAQGNANHIHTVWRDRRNDLGKNALEEHYRDAH